MKHVLVVDDSLVIRKTLEEYLQKSGYKVSTVEDGANFFKFISETIPDLIILDKILPDEDGFDILCKLKLNQSFNNIPVILFTTHDEFENEMQGLKLGAECFLSKDTKLEELELWVDKLIAKQEKIKVIKDNLDTLSKEIADKEGIILEKVMELRDTNRKLRNLSEDLIQVLLKTLEVRDVYTRNHSMNISKLSLIIASYMGMNHDQVADLKIAGYLHDIGKIGITDSILKYPSRLDDKKKRVIENHANIGGDIIGSVSSLKHLAGFIKHHHENFDGTGYPDKLKGDKIPAESRIIRIADFFDALSTDRVYRPAFSVERTIAMMKDKSEQFFDPEILDIFLEVINKSSPIKT